MTQIPSRAVGRLARYERARSRPEMTLLRGHHLEWVLSVFAEHLAAGPVELSALHERVEVELAQVRAIGWGDVADSARTARDYCNDWVDRGWLNRALVDGVEQYTLTAASLDVLAFADRLVDRRSTVSESRLKQILDAVARLSDEADPDPQACAGLPAARHQSPSRTTTITANPAASGRKADPSETSALGCR